TIGRARPNSSYLSIFSELNTFVNEKIASQSKDLKAYAKKYPDGKNAEKALQLAGILEDMTPNEIFELTSGGVEMAMTKMGMKIESDQKEGWQTQALESDPRASINNGVKSKLYSLKKYRTNANGEVESGITILGEPTPNQNAFVEVMHFFAKSGARTLDEKLRALNAEVNRIAMNPKANSSKYHFVDLHKQLTDGTYSKQELNEFNRVMTKDINTMGG
ncbi:unnamed protein product, partial [marine sediment metagenome]